MAYHEIKTAANRRRHGRMVNGKVSAKELRALVKQHHGLCAYCRSAKAETLDHVVPIAHGGKHEIANILPACERCNFNKHDKSLSAWVSHLRMLAA